MAFVLQIALRPNSSVTNADAVTALINQATEVEELLNVIEVFFCNMVLNFPNSYVIDHLVNCV